MLNFIKENSQAISKIIITQVGMTVFGLVLAMATTQNDALFLGTSIFSVLFYLFLLYSYGWEIGIKDEIRVAAGRLERRNEKFYLIGLAANAGNFLMAVLAMLGFLLMGAYVTVDPLTMEETMAYAQPWAANLFGVCNALARFLQAMYLGIIQTIALSVPFLAEGNPLLLLFIPIPAILVLGFSYQLGVNGRTLRGLLGIRTAYDVDRSQSPQNH